MPDPTPASGAVAPNAEGGDPACWLAQVCTDCGTLNENPIATCWRCGATRSPEEA